jgi:hypothetical protein
MLGWSTVDVFNLIGYLTRADTLEAGTPCGWSFVTAFKLPIDIKCTFSEELQIEVLNFVAAREGRQMWGDDAQGTGAGNVPNRVQRRPLLDRAVAAQVEAVKEKGGGPPIQDVFVQGNGRITH